MARAVVVDSSRTILIVGPSWVGDIVIAQSLFITLRQHHPAAAIDVLAPPWSRSIVTRMPEVREAIELPVRHGRLGLPTRWRIGRDLRPRNYDWAIVLPQSFKSALVPFFAGATRRTGYRGEYRYGLINDVRTPQHPLRQPMAQRYVALGLDRASALPQRLPYPRIRVDEPNRRRLIDELGLSLDRPVVGCVPGNEFGPAKAWPVESFCELTRRLVSGGNRVWVFGSDRERTLGERIRSAAGGEATNLCGRTRLEDAADLISLTSEVVSNDSGLMHVAAAVGTRVIAIYGSSTPRYTPPLTDDGEVLYLELECSPCFERHCPLGHMSCLRDISVDAVWAAIRRNPA